MADQLYDPSVKIYYLDGDYNASSDFLGATLNVDITTLSNWKLVTQDLEPESVRITDSNESEPVYVSRFKYPSDSYDVNSTSTLTFATKTVTADYYKFVTGVVPTSGIFTRSANRPIPRYVRMAIWGNDAKAELFRVKITGGLDHAYNNNTAAFVTVTGICHGTSEGLYRTNMVTS